MSATTTTTGRGNIQGTIHVPGGVAPIHGTQTMGQTSKTTQLSEFAKRAAPPDNPLVMTMGGTLGAGVVAALLWFLNELINGPRGGSGTILDYGGWALAVIAVLFAFGFVWSVTQFGEHRAAVNRWKRGWICQSCGTVFDPRT